jgi:hypothetical protein
MVESVRVDDGMSSRSVMRWALLGISNSSKEAASELGALRICRGLRGGGRMSTRTIHTGDRDHELGGAGHRRATGSE